MEQIIKAKQPESLSFYYGLSHLRAFAILFVFLNHYRGIFSHPDWVNSIGKFGWTGVDLFFVLSGYLISSQLFSVINKGEAISFRNFITKRFFRIVPAYLIVLTLYFLFPYIHEREALSPLWKYSTFTQNFGLDLRTQGTFSHAWSLCVEEQFYLLFPIILLTLIHFNKLKIGAWLLFILFIFGFIVRFYFYKKYTLYTIDHNYSWTFWYQWVYYPTYCRLDGLIAGISIAALFEFKPLIKMKVLKWGNLFLALGIIILIGSYFLCEKKESSFTSIWGFPMISLGYGFITISALSPSCFLYKTKSFILEKITTLSFGIYLTHKFILHITQDQLSLLGIEPSSNLMFLICIITSLLAALLLNILIEQPALKLYKELVSK